MTAWVSSESFTPTPFGIICFLRHINSLELFVLSDFLYLMSPTLSEKVQNQSDICQAQKKIQNCTGWEEKHTIWVYKGI